MTNSSFEPQVAERSYSLVPTCTCRGEPGNEATYQGFGCLVAFPCEEVIRPPLAYDLVQEVLYGTGVLVLSRCEVTADGGEGAEERPSCCQHPHGARGLESLVLHGRPGDAPLAIVPRAREATAKLEGRQFTQNPVNTAEKRTYTLSKQGSWCKGQTGTHSN